MYSWSLAWMENIQKLTKLTKEVSSIPRVLNRRTEPLTAVSTGAASLPGGHPSKWMRLLGLLGGGGAGALPPPQEPSLLMHSISKLSNAPFSPTLSLPHFVSESSWQPDCLPFCFPPPNTLISYLSLPWRNASKTQMGSSHSPSMAASMERTCSSKWSISQPRSDPTSTSGCPLMPSTHPGVRPPWTTSRLSHAHPFWPPQKHPKEQGCYFMWWQVFLPH